MVDIKSILDSVQSFRISINPEILRSTLTTLIVTYGTSKLVRYFQRGKRLGRIAAPIDVARDTSWLLRKMAKFGISERICRGIGNLIAAAVFMYLTFITVDQYEIPFKPVVPALVACIATLNLWLLSRANKGVCIGFSKGLLIEGVFYNFDKFYICKDIDDLRFNFKRSSFLMSFSDFEKNKKYIYDMSIHIKYDLIKKEKYGELTLPST